MKGKIMGALALVAFALCAGSAPAADNSWMQTTPDNAPKDGAWMAKKLRKDLSAPSTIPIGSILVWSRSVMPDKGEWLECNGQTVSAAKYPKYVAKFGTTLPDYRGYFLRGEGETKGSYNGVKGKSGALGEEQAAQVGDHSHEMGQLRWGEYLYWVPDHTASGNEAVTWKRTGVSNRIFTDSKMYEPYEKGKAEPRPFNKAVKYIIKVR